MRSPVTQAVPLRDRRHTAPSWRRSSVNDDHLPTGLVGLHDAMSLTYLVDPGRLRVEPPGRGVRSIC